jgi:dCTP deaminase
MVLSDVDIKRYIAMGKIKVTPELPPEQFGSCSVDFRLGSEFGVFEYSRHPYIDLKEKVNVQEVMRTVRVPAGEPFVLQPRDFVLAITEETLELSDDVLGRLEGRSSLGRIGIIVHGTAGLFDPGWTGKATLELSNLGRMAVALYADLFLHVRATVVAGGGFLSQQARQQIRRTDQPAGQQAGQ